MSAKSFAVRPAFARGASSSRAVRLGLTVLLFLMLTVAANAYTLVLRSGRHVTIPGHFKVTPAAVVYEASPGFYVTVWLSNVDIGATEKANAEPAGSFARRVTQEPEGAGAAPAPEALKTNRRTVRRVITNKDLEPSRLRRQAQEEEYERTRRERGMPSKQELQQRIEQQDRALSEWARQMEEERREAELESLRSEMLNVRRDLNELSLHLSRQAPAYVPVYVSPNYYPYFYAPPVQVITVFPFGRRGPFGHGSFGTHPHGRRWPLNRWPGHPFPANPDPFRNAGSQPQVLAPALPARRR